MALSSIADERLRRLRRLAHEHNIPDRFDTTPLTRPSDPPSPLAARDPEAEKKAEDLLKRRRLASAQDLNGSNGGAGSLKKRPFTLTRKDSFASKEIFDTLDAHVSNAGAPSVAEALLHRLRLTGGDLNRASTKSKSSFNLRRRSLDNLGQEQSKILQKAVENGHEDMVAVLVPHADLITLDAALPLALRIGNLQITETLLRYGANLSQTPDGQFQFRQMCINGGQADLVGLVLRSEGRPAPDWVSGAMIDAAKKGCVATVAQLSRSVADGNFNDGAALKEAVLQCRIDVALAILTGTKPPGKQVLNEAFAKVYTQDSTMEPAERMRFTNALLLAGAQGDVVSAALAKACASEYYELIDLLIKGGASIDFQGALAVTSAIDKGNRSLVQLLLSDRAVLSPNIAADLVEKIPKRTNPEDRRLFLSLLLRKGAKGPPLDDALIAAVESGDSECVKLLLTADYIDPVQTQPRTSHIHQRGSQGMVTERHAVADVNAKGGLALLKAVHSGDLLLFETILAAKPTMETLQMVFPSIHQLESTERLIITESFLNAGVSGPHVSKALQEAIEETQPGRDDRLIELLLQHDVESNPSDGAPLLSAIEQQDVSLLEALLKKRPISTANAPVALAKAMSVEDWAVRNEHPKVLEVVLQTGKATAETMGIAMQAIASLPSSKEKATKLESIVKRTKQPEITNSLLVKEVQAILQIPPQEQTLAVLQVLLAAGVDINAHKAVALCTAVAKANTPITDILITAKPSTQSLAAAMPYACKIQDPAERLIFVQKLVNAGVPAAEANRALVYAIKSASGDPALMDTLVTRADTSDGEALMHAIKGASVPIVELLMTKAKKHPAARLSEAVAEAAKIENKEVRRSICELLLKAGASGRAVSDALLAAARTGDMQLGTMLMNHGASLDHQEGQAVVEACRAGSSDVLQMLLSNERTVRKETLERGFQAATEVRDLTKRGAVFKLLLDKGVAGEVVNVQFVSAGRYGDDAIDLVKLLLRYGASPNYNGGEAVHNATRCAFLGILEVMLGIIPVGGKQQRPSVETLVRALKASSKLSGAPRYQVVKWLFTAGLPVREEVHIALNKAVNEEEPSIDLIELLLAHGASPLTNGCKSLVDATSLSRADILDLFLRGEIPERDLAWTFSQAFIPNEAGRWLSEPGFQVAHRLLEKGARGDGLEAALNVAIDHMGPDKDDIARRFVDLLVQYDTEVDRDQGEALTKAAKRANVHLMEQLLQRKPNSESVSMAFPYVFDHDLTEVEALELVSLFTDYRDGETQLDALFTHPECEPIMYKAISRYPRSSKIVQTLLDAGYYHDQMGSARIFGEIEEPEQVNLLVWCLLQPQKKVSSGIIALLIERGARVNFETRVSKTTPLMLAIKERRHDIVKQLVLAGAEVDVADITGNTPLTLTTQIGGELGTMMMKNVLAAEPSQNDGSLHNAARELNLPAMQVLVDFGHEVDFPSTLHGGRTALGELCLHAADNGALTAAQEKAMEKAIAYLMQQGTDLSLLSDDRSVLLLAMGSLDPVATTRALLKVGMWKHINRPFNNFTAGGCTYSPTQYVKRILPQSNVTEELHTLLKANRAQDVYYANDGPQPEGAVGLPDDIVRAERERRTRLERIRLEAEDHARTLERTKEVADMQNQILAQRAQLEDARARQLRSSEMEGIRERAQVEEELFNKAIRRKRAERAAAMQHEAALTQAEVGRKQLVAATEFESEGRRQLQLLEYEKQLNGERVDHARQMSIVRVGEREQVDRLDREHDARIKNRIVQQKQLVDSQNQLATNLSAVGMPQRRQVGYISGELD
ncbi:hypothetical protein VPNG_01597 [Cytospora leucostoma]|uniref:Uncharacterized protein n=1 Tax=Cytospora leucostoma TaxID=1230097 RepID=A0A423XJY8_9PEZI|nr:hypothetical protein VPNG_01597 [Cytospora leucostoma]